MKADLPTEPVIFLKPSTALVENGVDIAIPSISHEMHHEVEMVVLVGPGGRNIPTDEAAGHVLGYGVGLDLTLRDLQAAAKAKGLPWTISKGFDGSAPVSEIVPAAGLERETRFEIACSVNGTRRQHASTASMIFPVGRLIEYISSIFTLETGDLIFTGTPEGVGPLKPGDVVEAELTGHASIRHRVAP